MAAHGRPTPQVESLAADNERPRFKDRAPESFLRADINPYLDGHRTFGPELLAADDAWRWRGRWHERFGRQAPLHLEIGSGNGFFLSGLATVRPYWDLVGVEIRYKRTVMCAEKLRKVGAKNAVICRYHGAYLDDLFEDGSLSGIYVNHPDPWPKERHEKNRLISRWFLEDVARLLKPGGHFRLKSDFEDNIARIPSLLAADGDGNPLDALPLRVTHRCDDVNATPAPWADEDIETNYQRKFKAVGLPVYAIELVRT